MAEFGPPETMGANGISGSEPCLSSCITNSDDNSFSVMPILMDGMVASSASCAILTALRIASTSAFSFLNRKPDNTSLASG